MNNDKLPFYVSLIDTVRLNSNNYFGKDNYDEIRFGQFTESTSLVKKLINQLNAYRIRNYWVSKAEDVYKQYGPQLESIYNLLNKTDRHLLTLLVAYRVMGYTKIKLPKNDGTYWNKLEDAKKLIRSNKTIDPQFMDFILYDFDLSSIGFDLKFFFTPKGVVTDFILEQYAYHKEGVDIEVKKDDVVFDLGACWGDTALYFASKAGENGKVFSFEFIPGNLNILNQNLALNPRYKDVLTVITNPVSDKSGELLYYNDAGPGSKVQPTPFQGQVGTVKTVCIDDVVREHNLSRVDFIKMDIEGSEPRALNGALETIKKFKPKLAIAIYHGMDDFTNIPLWIHNLNLGYKLYLEHFTIHHEETIIFATAG